VIRRRWAHWAVLLAALSAPEASHAQGELQRFSEAKASFDASNYAESVARFAPLVDGGPASLTDRIILQEARRYYAASLVLVGRAGDAAETFRALLEADPEAEMSSSLFTQRVIEVFEEVRRDMEQELREQREAIRIAEEAARLREEARIRQEIVSKAVLYETVVVRRPMWQGALPFGIAQFQNDQNGKGVLFLVSESLMLATNVASFWLSQPLPAADDIPVNRALARGLFYVNVSSLAVFGALLVVGGWDGLSNLTTESRMGRRLTPEEVRDAIDQGERESGDR
jgi:hypothetical protein